MTILYNIGHSGTLGSGIHTYFPMSVEVESFSDFAQSLRSDVFITDMFDYAEENWITPSSITLFLVADNHRFAVKLINIKEYRAKWEAKYKTKWDKSKIH